MLARVAGNPFEVVHAIPLGGISKSLNDLSYLNEGLDSTTVSTNDSSFGGNGDGIPDNSFHKTVVVCNLPANPSEETIRKFLEDYKVNRAEILRNPDRKARRCGVAELSSVAEVNEVLKKFSLPKEFLGKTSYEKPYVIHMPSAAFPCVGVGDCCSVNDSIS